MPALLALALFILLILGFVIFIAVKSSPKTTKLVNSILTESDSDQDSKELIKQAEDDKRRLHDKEKKISSTVDALEQEEKNIKNYLNPPIKKTRSKKGKG